MMVAKRLLITNSQILGPSLRSPVLGIGSQGTQACQRPLKAFTKHLATDYHIDQNKNLLLMRRNAEV